MQKGGENKLQFIVLTVEAERQEKNKTVNTNMNT